MKPLFLFALLLFHPFHALGETFTVTTATDSDRDPAKGYSLRDAINDANLNPGPDRIVFAIPAGGGVARIVLTTELPSLREAVEIDGYTQPGARRNALALGNDAVLKVEIDATNTEENYSRSMFIRADGCVVSGLILNNGLEAGLVVSFGNDNVITGNWIGVQADGISPSAGRRNRDGVWVIHGSRNRVGGPLPGDRNLISGNRSSGVLIDGADSTDNLVLNNYIGTDKSGTLALPNQIGVWLAGNSNQVGNASVAGRNIISGNSAFGVQISPWSGARPQGNTIAGNYVGLAVDGDQPLPNEGTGFVLVDAEQNTIGSIVPGGGNVISGNGQAGIYLLSHYGSSLDPGVVTRGNVIIGNYIGTDATGTQARGNGASGVVLESDPVGSMPDNRIGAVELGVRMGNVISGNQGNGIQITGAKAVGTIIEANFIGVDRTGGKALPNGWGGILVGPGEDNPSNGSPRSTRIGGLDPSGLAGNVISGNKFDGIALDFAPTPGEPTGGSHTLLGNFIGTDATGRSKIPNEQFGISLRGACSDCEIGGNQPLARNVISGNAWDGVAFVGQHNTLTRVRGNFIGTDRTGRMALPNGLNGISLGSKVSPLNGVRGNLVGGAESADRNVISGNAGQGVFIGNGSENWVEGNYIGLDVTGTAPLGNQSYGVAISATTAAQTASTNHIGSLRTGGGNLICANDAGGVVVEGTNAIGNILQGNYIGTDPRGSMAVGNLGTGLRMTDAVGTIVGRGPVGNPDPLQANVIQYNNGYGIQVTGDAAINNCIRGNIVSANADRALLLGANEGANDPGDKDKGPNGLMNYPIVVRSYFDRTGGVTRISGRIDHVQRQKLIIDLYQMDVPVAVGAGDAERYLVSATPDQYGRFCAQVPGDLGAALVSATATSPEGSTSGFSRAAAAKLRLKALEVTQCVQDWSNSVPLIQDKRTLVRAFLEPLTGGRVPVPVAGLKARLHAFKDGEALPDSPQPPANLADIVSDTNSSKQRTNAAASVNFFLPAAWRQGSIELQFEADGVICGEPDVVAEAPFECRDCAVAVDFNRMSPLPLNVADVSYVSRGVIHTNGLWDLGLIERLIESTFPIPRLASTRKSVAFAMWPTNGECEFVNRKLLDLAAPFSDVRTLGLLPIGPGVGQYAGLAGGIPSTVASAYYSVPFGWFRLTPVHELSHAFGRAHAILHASTNGTLVGNCGEQRDLEGDPFFPYGFIEPATGLEKPTLGPMDKGTNSLTYGVDLVSDNMADNPIMAPTAIFELMSYCKNFGGLDRWMSSATYRRLFDDLKPRSTNARPAMQRLAQAPVGRDFLIVRGDANLRAGTVAFRPFSRWQGLAPAWTPSVEGAYQLEMVGNGGVVLLQTNFDPTPYDACGRETSLAAGFNLPVPWDPAYREARISRQGVVLVRQSATPNAPQVTKVTPNGGEVVTAEQLTVAWDAQDPDGTPLTFDVEFSPDAGTTWQALESETSLRQFSVPRSLLPGTARALVRVTASDGFHTASRTSASVFALPNQPPTVQVLSPTTGQWYQPGQQFSFAVSVQDREEGLLGETNLVWYGGNGLRLGTGPTLIGNTDRLLKGSQKIRVVAFDSDGRAVTNNIPITVSDKPLAEYVDLSVESAVSSPEATLGEKLTWTVLVRNSGTAPATGVFLTNRFAPVTQIISMEASQGKATNLNGQVIVALGEIFPGTETTLTLVTAAERTGSIRISNEVQSAEPDIAPANNSGVTEAIVSTQTPLRPDLLVTIERIPASAQPGLVDEVYTSVVNKGMIAANQVALTNTIPTGVTLLSTEISPGGAISVNGQETRAWWPSLGPGGQANVRLHVRVDSASPMLFQAAGYAAEADEEPRDNFMTSVVPAVTGSDISVIRDTGGVVIEWPESRAYVVDQSDVVGLGQSWRPVQGTPVLSAGRWRLSVPATGRTQFYRFRQP